MKTVGQNLLVVLLFLAAIFNIRGGNPWDHGNLEVDGHMLKHSDGIGFFWMGDTAWDMFYKLTEAEAITYIENRSNKKFTVIQAVGMSFRGLSTTNAYGEKAFINDNISTPNPAFWSHVDFIVQKAAENGIYIALLPTWGSVYVGWGGGTNTFNETNARTYGEWIGNRYKDQANIIWILGGDVSGGAKAVWDAMANGIKSVDTNHLMTFHPYGADANDPLGHSSSEWFPDSTWLDFNMIQTGHRGTDLATYTKITEDYERSPSKPVLDGESRYEAIQRNLEAGYGIFEAFDVRETAYWEVFAGACGHTYGHNSLWQIYNPGDNSLYGATIAWNEALDATGGTQMQYLSELMQSRPVLGRIPDQSLIASGQGNGANHLQATRGNGYALLYIPSGNSVEVQMGKISGTEVRAWWYNPRTGEASEIATYSNSGTVTFTPAGNQERGNDWVLVLDDVAKNYGEPGVIGSTPDPDPTETVYENAEDGNTDGWFRGGGNGIIANVTDSDKGGRVIEFSNAGLWDSNYTLTLANGNSWNNDTQFIASWSMKYSDDYVVYFDVETSDGHRYLQYENSNNDILGTGEYVRHGLGDVNGTWQSFERDLQADLHEAQPTVNILKVNGIIIRGSGRIDDIKLKGEQAISYVLTVVSGSGAGNYIADTIVNIVAAPPATNKQFDKWTGDTANIADINAANTTITMPDSTVSISATYKDKTNTSETVYEDAEDGNTDGWVATGGSGIVTNVTDADKGGRVIEFSNSELMGSYYTLNLANGDSWNNNTQFTASWSMKYSGNYIIYFDVETSAGHRYLQYENSNNDILGSGEYVRHGLGDVNGTWQTFERDLQADLHEAQPDATLLKVNGIIIRGSGLIDDIKLKGETSVAETVYEDAEDGNSDGWLIGGSGSVANVTDADKGGRVIEFSNADLWDSNYTLSLANGDSWDNSTQFIASWSMKYSGDYVVYFDVETSAGHRYLYYNSNSNNSLGSDEYIHHGLGATSNNGSWQTLERDLQADLHEAQPDATLLKVNGIIIRGSGLIDDIKLKGETSVAETVYEDAEDGNSDGWIIGGSGSVANVTDADKGGRVIEFSNAGLWDSNYTLTLANGNSWNNDTQFIASWSMKYSGDYVVYFDVETSAGHRYLYYNSNSNNSLGSDEYIHHGLGATSNNGSWQTLERDLQADLHEAQPDATLLKVNGVIFRGNGRVDDIKLKN